MTASSVPPDKRTPTRRGLAGGPDDLLRTGVVCLVLVLGLALLGGIAGLVVGREATAEARVVVGTGDLAAQQVPGYSAATVAMAETYARYVTEADRASLPGDARVSASVVAETPVIRVQATAGTPETALSAVTSATEELISEVNEGGAERATDLAEQIGEVNSSLAALRQEADKLSEQSEEWVDVDTQIRLADLRIAALSRAYEDAYADQVSPATALTLIEDPHPVDETVPQSALVGAVAGGVLGGLLALAWLMLRRRSRLAP